MTWKQFFTSSVGRKFIMGGTGFFLIFFLIVHAGLNATIFYNDDGTTFNFAARFMSHNIVMRILEIGLFVFLILHAYQGLLLWKKNRDARPVKYYMNKKVAGTKWYSRSMGLLGTLILLFLIMHLGNFWVGTKKELYFGHGVEVTDLYTQMRNVFTEWYWVVAYMVGLFALFWHLMHGFTSAFQTFGMGNHKFKNLIKFCGTVYSVLICLLFASMPLSFYFGWLS